MASDAGIADWTLDALALVGAVSDRSTVNRDSILKSTDSAALVAGLTQVAVLLRFSLAAAWACPVSDVDELLRAVFLIEQAAS
jgi:hypothetical protein